MLNKRIKRLLLILLVLLMCALPVMASGQEDLIDVDLQIQQEVSYITTEVRSGSFLKEVQFPATEHFPLFWKVSCPQTGSFLAEYVVSQWTTVKAGDALVKLSMAVDEIELARMERELSRMREEFKAAVSQREEEISDAMLVLEEQTDVYEKERQSIAIQILETELAQFCYLQQRIIDAKEKEVNTWRSWQDPLILTAPADGVVTALAEKNPGDAVYAGEVLVTLVQADVRLLKVNDSAGELRYNMPVTVTVGRGDNQTMLTGRVIAADDAIPEEHHMGVAYILLDPGFEEVELQEPKVSAYTVRLDDVLLVDRSAVVRENGHYFVTKLTDGMVQRRCVLFGMSNVTETWIMEGVAEGETLILD